MRETRLERQGEALMLHTDDAGTVLTGADGLVRTRHGTDQHETMLHGLRRDGWRVASDDHVAPPIVLPAPPAATPAQGGTTATVTDGEAG